jgi:hypothetical protein
MRPPLALAVLLLPVGARAQEWAVGLRASAEHVAASDHDGDEGVGMGGGGLLVRWRFWPHWGVEAALESCRGTRADGAYERRSDSLVLTAALHLTPRSRWDWYLFLGLGGATDHVTLRGADGATVEQQFKESVLRLGVGLERRWEHIGIGAELAGIGMTREDQDQAQPKDAVPARSGGGQLSVVFGYYF